MSKADMTIVMLYMKKSTTFWKFKVDRLISSFISGALLDISRKEARLDGTKGILQKSYGAVSGLISRNMPSA